MAFAKECRYCDGPWPDAAAREDAARLRALGVTKPMTPQDLALLFDRCYSSTRVARQRAERVAQLAGWRLVYVIRPEVSGKTRSVLAWAPPDWVEPVTNTGALRIVTGPKVRREAPPAFDPSQMRRYPSFDAAEHERHLAYIASLRGPRV